MDKQCKKCATDIDHMNDLYTVCEGRCARRFHASCVGVSEDALCVFSKNIIWMCDECMFEFCKARDSVPLPPRTDSLSSITSELDELRAQVAKINDAIVNINNRIISSDPPQRYSTPLSTPKTKSPNNTISTAGMSSQSCDDSFSLVLTNIECSVTEVEIVQLVSHSLRAPEPECLDVTKLVPNWKSCKDMDYISFKIVLHNRWKQSAMNVKTWPPGVRFREFVSKLNDTWKPAIVEQA